MKRILISSLVGVFAVGCVALATDIIVNGNANINLSDKAAEQSLGGFYSPMIMGPGEQTKQINQTDATGTSTVQLLSLDTGSTVFLKGSSTDVVLPPVEDGLFFRFQVNGAIDTGSGDTNYHIKSSEGDNIEGTLIVAGAVVDCAAEDQINILDDGENLGDYVEFMSDGSQWMIVDSGVLTAAKMTCTDPS